MNVKSLSAIVIATIFSCAVVSAQSVKHELGFFVGGAYSSARSDLFTTASGQMGATAGCSFVFNFGDRFSLTQDVAFVQRGTSARAVQFLPEREPVISSYEYKYNAFEVGALAGFSPFRNIPLSIQGGGYFGSHFHNMNGDKRDLYLGDYNSVNDARPAYKLIDAFSGIDFGPAVGISAGKGNLRVNARYYLGMRNLYNNLDFVQPGSHIRTNSIRVTVSYFL
jgi:hypothetical protein